MDELFFPVLRRQKLELYRNRDGKYYADYKSNYEKVSEDCLKRCVYCDATERECGGDRFSLDHFRPRKVFAEKFDGVLLTHPFNLYLSCQKCNVLKSSDWHGCQDTIDGYTYRDKKGYLDRFSTDPSEYLSVDSEGNIQALKADGPVEYMIKKLHLNRPNRAYLRMKRIINQRVKLLVAELNDLGDDVEKKYNSGVISAEECIERIACIREIQKELCEL